MHVTGLRLGTTEYTYRYDYQAGLGSVLTKAKQTNLNSTRNRLVNNNNNSNNVQMRRLIQHGMNTLTAIWGASNQSLNLLRTSHEYTVYARPSGKTKAPLHSVTLIFLPCTDLH